MIVLLDTSERRSRVCKQLRAAAVPAPEGSESSDTEREAIADIIEDHLAFTNGWRIEDRSYRYHALKAADRIIARRSRAGKGERG